MNKMQRRFATISMAGLTTLLLSQAALVAAQEDESRNPFSFWVAQSFVWDSNLYRLSDRVPDSDVPKGKRSDRYSFTRVGVDFDSEYSRQAFHAGLSLGKTLYKTHSNLNNTSGDAQLRWDWRVGDRWSGVLGYSYGIKSVDFDNVHAGANSIEREKAMRQLGRANVSADYWWHPDWATGFGFSDVRSSYRDDARPWDEYNAQQASLNFTYRPSTGNRIVLGFVFEEGQYPNQDKVRGSLRDWERRDLRLSGQWRLTGVTQLSGYVGYTQRKYDLAPNRDFSGMTGSLALHWVPTGKAVVDLSWRREIGADQDPVSNYAVTQGWTVGPAWLISSKVRLGANYEYLDRSYDGDPGGSSWLYHAMKYPKKDRKIQSYGVYVKYMPVSNADIQLKYQDSRSDAAEDWSYEFRAKTVWLSGSMTF